MAMRQTVVVGVLTLAALHGHAVPASAAPVYKIGNVSTPVAGFNDFVVFKNHVYFAGGTTDGSGTGIELWRTDGTEAGTTLVKDINPGSSSSLPYGSWPAYLTVVRDDLGNETLYFTANDGTHGRELWKSDGTPDGTVLVKDLTAGAGDSIFDDLTPVLGQLVFRIGALGVGKSDGTDAGTVTWTMTNSDIRNFLEFDGALYFSADALLWRSDLVAAPTQVSAVQVRTIFTLGGGLYFTNLDGRSFYRSDGTDAGTTKVLDLPSLKEARDLRVAGLRAFFLCADGYSGKHDLWQFDGAAASMASAVEPWRPFVDIGGALFFHGNDGVHGWELWTSDGSTTRMVKDINPGSGDSSPQLGALGCSPGNDDYDRCRAATLFGGSIYFFADDGVHGNELWKTDGTEAGTVLVEDLRPGPEGAWDVDGSAMRAYGDEYLVLQATLSGPPPAYKLHGLSLSPPRFAIEDGSAPEGTASPSNAVLNVHLLPPSASATTVQWATADGTATAGVDYTAATGTLNFPAGSPVQTISVPLVPDTTPELAKTFHVQLSSSSGPPIGRGLADVTILDDDGPTLSIDDITVQENVGTATFTVTRSAVTSDPVQVDYTTVAGTATAGSDFAAKTGSVTFSAGQLTRPVTVSITNDTYYEPDEVFFVRLSGPRYGVLGDAEGQCTIVNDDAAPTLAVADVTMNEGNTGTSNMTFTARLSAASAYTVTVDFATADGTATAGTDYQAQSGTLTIPAGTTSATIVVPIVGDLIDEANETLTLDLTNPVNATLARVQATGTINNNDIARISMANVTAVEGASGTTTTATFKATLSLVSAFTVTVDYATAPGTTSPATDGVDYTGVSGTLTFPPGTVGLDVPVTVMGDNLDEGTSETFFLNLTNPVNAALQTTRATGTITDDDVARFAVGDVSVVEGHSGNVAATLTVTLGAAWGSDASVKYYTQRGTTQGDTVDYVGISDGSATGALLLSFPAGTVTQQVAVQVIGDTIREAGNEYFNFNLTGASGGPAVADGQARVTILDDDLLATDRRLSIAPKSASVTEPLSGETPVSFTVSLIPASGTTATPSGLPVTVSLVAGGTASAPDDYASVPTTLTFAPGTATRTVTTAVKADAVLENPEAAILTLANPTNATIATTSTTTSGSATLNIYDSVSYEALDFYTVDPCRAVDTRYAATGGPTPVAAGAPRTFTIGGLCGIPATARAISANVTVTRASAAGNARVYPGGTALPSTSNLNFAAGVTRANNAIVLLGDLADITVALDPTGTAHVIVDVNGYME